jgi:hypothetical protein
VALISMNPVGNRRWWSQVVAARLGVPANVVAVWSQSGGTTGVSDPVIGPLSWGLVARREGFEPPTARSVVSHNPSPPVLLVPSRPPLVLVNGHDAGQAGNPSPPVTRGMVAMWSQFRAAVTLVAAPSSEHQIEDLVLCRTAWGRLWQVTRG